MSSVAVLVLFIYGVLLFIAALFVNQIKGAIGEKKISAILYLLDPSKYKVINNVVLTNGGKTSQIDHLVVSDFGVFVIETKNYKGWILGGENSEYWTQVIYKRKEKFYNPIRQNYGHILALKSCLREFPNIKYTSIIVFSSKAELKVHTSTQVTYSYKLLKEIKKHTVDNLTEDDKEEIFRKISAANSSDTYNRSEHITSIKKRIQTREKSIEEGICPQCGNNLIFRKGKFGRFIGCSSYPRCKFTRNI